MGSSVRGNNFYNIYTILSFSISGALFWLLLTLLIRSFQISGHYWSLIGTIYCVVYFVFYTLRVNLPHITSRWQVPSTWLHDYSLLRQITVWSATLGPGIMTRNPYSSMWVIPIAVCLYPNLIFGCLVGFAHGLGRAVNIIMIAKRMDKGKDLWESLLEGNENGIKFNYASILLIGFIFAIIYFVSYI